MNNHLLQNLQKNLWPTHQQVSAIHDPKHKWKLVKE